MTAQAPARPLRFAGYAAVFGRRDSGGDTIVPGAFTASLAARKARGGRLPLFWQHRPDKRIGWIDLAEEDAHGLRVIATVTDPDGGPGRALARGAANGLSFGYHVRDGRKMADGRELRSVDLLEVSLVTRPMQPLARVHMIDRALTLSSDPDTYRNA